MGLLSHCLSLAILPDVRGGRRGKQLSLFYFTTQQTRGMTGFHVLKPLGPAHLYPYLQSQLHCATQSRYRASSKCCSQVWAYVLSHPWGWLTVPLSSGPAPLCCPGEMQALLSRVLLQLAMVRDSSFTLMTPGPVLPTAVGGEECRVGEGASPLPPHHPFPPSPPTLPIPIPQNNSPPPFSPTLLPILTTLPHPHDLLRTSLWEGLSQQRVSIE